MFGDGGGDGRSGRMEWRWGGDGWSGCSWVWVRREGGFGSVGRDFDLGWAWTCWRWNGEW